MFKLQISISANALEVIVHPVQNIVYSTPLYVRITTAVALFVSGKI
jgi:hypothetical protein